MFGPACREIVLKKEFGTGLSGGRVLEIRPLEDEDTPQLRTIVKLAAISLIQKEWQAYRRYIRHKLPKIADVIGEPTLLPHLGWGGLRYPLLGGGGTFRIETLLTYCRRPEVTVENILPVLRDLFKIMHNIWGYADIKPEFHLQQSYDRLLPVNLFLEHTPVRDPCLVSPTTLPTTPPALGAPVRLSGFVVTKVDLVDRTITLTLPASSDRPAYFVRFQSEQIETMATCQVGQVMETIEGTIKETRTSRLQQEGQRALGSAFDLAGKTVSLPDGTTLPNPLTAWPGWLKESGSVKWAVIHGDFNLENILIEPDRGAVSLIDFAEAREDHVLHDFLRLETEVMTKLVPEILLRHRLDVAPTIYDFYQQLHWATLQQPASVEPRLAHPDLEKPFKMVHLIRQTARYYLFKPDDEAEYYRGLALYLLGAMKFTNLDEPFDSLDRSLPKQVAFWGAASLMQIVEAPAPLPAKEKAAPGPLPVTWLAAGGAVLAVGLALAVLLVWPWAGLWSSGEPLATIIGFKPVVKIERTGSDRLTTADFNLPLYQGDLLYTRTGATVTIACQNGLLIYLPEQRTMAVECRRDSNVAQVMVWEREIGQQLVSGSLTEPELTVPAGVSYTRSNPAQTALQLTPRNSTIAEARPTFRWQPAPDGGPYRLTLTLSDGPAWSRETAGSSLTYPPEAPALAPGSLAVVELESGNGSVDKTVLTRLEEPDLAELNQAKAEIEALPVDETTRSFLLAQRYRQHGMWTDAIDQLERLTQAAPSPYLWQQLGNLYWQIELYLQAQENYHQALAAAEADENLNAQAAAQVGLARTAQISAETTEALERLAAAETLYRQAGQPETADRVAAERARIKAR